MSQPPDRVTPANPFDPFGLWKRSQDELLESWSKAMVEAVNTDAYTETTGRMLDTYLTASAPLRKIMEQTMAQVLSQLSLPSRAEVVSLAERLTNIELRLDDLDARLDVIQRGVERAAGAVAALNPNPSAASGPPTLPTPATPPNPPATARSRATRHAEGQQGTASRSQAAAAGRRATRTSTAAATRGSRTKSPAKTE
jgi:hypothetical protein